MATLVKLSSVGSLYAPAAQSYERARIEVRLNHGWDLRPTDAASAMRTLAQQKSVFLRHYTRTPNNNSQRRFYQGAWWYRKNGSPAVAVPGTSNHGRGDTVDFSGLGGFGGTRYKQWSNVAKFHGWNNREGTAINEYWHWTHVAADDASAKAAGWYHVSREKGTQAYTAHGKKFRKRADQYNVRITGTIRWGGSVWGVTKAGNLYRMSHLVKGKSKAFKPRHYTVTATALNGRTGPGTNYPVKRVVKKGFRFKATQKKGDWVGSSKNTWFSLTYLK